MNCYGYTLKIKKPTWVARICDEKGGKTYANSHDFVLELIDKSGVVCVPGSEFGSLGEGYVRFALVHNVEDMKKIVQAIKESGIIKE